MIIHFHYPETIITTLIVLGAGIICIYLDLIDSKDKQK